MCQVWVIGWLDLCRFGLWACVDLSYGWVCADLGVEFVGWVHSQVNGLLMDLVRCVINMCKVVGLVCNVGLLPIALGLSFLDKRVGIGPIRTHLGPTCVQTTPCLPGFGYMPMASRAAIKKLWQTDIIRITQENTITTFSHNK